jgi:hypothetical protein
MSAKTTTPIRRREQPKKAAAEKATKLGNPRTEVWTDKIGTEIAIGATVTEPVAGIVKARCTRPERDGSRTPMVAIATTKPYTRNGRVVRIPTFPAAEVLMARELPRRKSKAKAAADDHAAATVKQ